LKYNANLGRVPRPPAVRDARPGPKPFIAVVESGLTKPLDATPPYASLVAALLTALGALAVFIVIYVALNRRAGHTALPEEQRGWLLAIVACAGVAVLIGILAR
jgi:hypothetical protein